MGGVRKIVTKTWRSEIFLQGCIISTAGDALSAVSRGLCLQITEDSGFVGSSSSEGCSITGVHIKGTMWQSLCTSLAFRYYCSVWPHTSSVQMGRMQISDCSSWNAGGTGPYYWSCGCYCEHVKGCCFIYPHYQEFWTCFQCFNFTVPPRGELPLTCLSVSYTHHWWLCLDCCHRAELQCYRFGVYSLTLFCIS